MTDDDVIALVLERRRARHNRRNVDPEKVAYWRNHPDLVGHCDARLRSRIPTLARLLVLA